MKKYQNEHPAIFLIAIIIIVFLLHVMTYLHLSVSTTKYTKTPGVVIEKYTKRYRSTSRRRRSRSYLKVKYTYNGEEKIAEGISANFWESEGSTVHVFLSSDGTATRSPGVTEYEIIMLICAIIFLAREMIKKRQTLSTAQSPSVGTVINDYDIPLDEPSTFEPSAPFAEPTPPETSSPFAEPANPGTSTSLNFTQRETPKQTAFELYTEEEYKQLKSKPSAQPETNETGKSKTSLSLRTKENQSGN